MRTVTLAMICSLVTEHSSVIAGSSCLDNSRFRADSRLQYLFVSHISRIVQV